MTCREICQRYRAKKPQSGSRYDDGQKRCTICNMWIKWDGIRCPCCNRVLRTTTRKRENKPINRIILQATNVNVTVATIDH